MSRHYTTRDLMGIIFEETEKIQARTEMHVLNIRQRADGAFLLTYVDNAFCDRFPAEPVKRWTAAFFAKTKTDIKRALKDLAKHRRYDIARYKRGESA